MSWSSAAGHPGRLLAEDSIVEASHAADEGSRYDAFPSAIDSRVDARDGVLVNPPAKCDALLVNHIRNDSLGNAERQWVNGEALLGPLAGSGRVRGREIEVEPKEGGNNHAGESPQQHRIPESARQCKKQIRHLNRVVWSSDGLDGGNSESISIGQNLFA